MAESAQVQLAQTVALVSIAGSLYGLSEHRIEVTRGRWG